MRLPVLVVIMTIAAALIGCAGGSDDFVEVPGIGSTRIDVARPTGPASAPCDGDPLPPASTETIAERVAALRAIGLFADRSAESTDEIAADIEAAIDETWGEVGDDLLPLMDLMVAEQDQARVWWRDLEADVADGNDVYGSTVRELAAISVGELSVIDVVETWDSEAGPVSVAVTLDGGAELELRPAVFEDWIDPGILVDLNGVMGDAGRRFESYKAFDQTAFVMALTEPERVSLEARGWCFE
jgi:hypothetical protein